jgi:hypothetical protein
VVNSITVFINMFLLEISDLQLNNRSKPNKTAAIVALATVAAL